MSGEGVVVYWRFYYYVWRVKSLICFYNMFKMIFLIGKFLFLYFFSIVFVKVCYTRNILLDLSAVSTIMKSFEMCNM